MAAIKLDPSGHQKFLEKRRQKVREWRLYKIIFTIVPKTYLQNEISF